MKLLIDEKRGTAIIPLPGAECLPYTLQFGGESFVRKAELHATLIGSSVRFDPLALRVAAKGLDFTVRPSGVYRRVELGAERSLIELVRIDEQEEFYIRLEVALGRPASVPRMPAHVTLFTEPGGGGIGLYNDGQLEAISEKAALRLPNSPWRLDGDGVILGA